MDEPISAAQGEGPKRGVPATSSPSSQQAKPPCPDCSALRQEVAQLRTSRDDAVLALAKERELLKALRLKYATVEPYLRRAQPWPLRYMLADKLNDALKGRFDVLDDARKGLRAFLTRWKRQRD